MDVLLESLYAGHLSVGHGQSLDHLTAGSERQLTHEGYRVYVAAPG